jgi:hypothetical protein
MAGYGRSDLYPIVWLEGLKRSREKIQIFPHHVSPPRRDEITNNGVDSLPNIFTVREHVLDCLSDPAQAVSTYLVFAGEITDLGSRHRIARRQLGQDQIFLGMVIHFRVVRAEASYGA